MSSYVFDLQDMVVEFARMDAASLLEETEKAVSGASGVCFLLFCVHAYTFAYIARLDPRTFILIT